MCTHCIVLHMSIISFTSHFSVVSQCNCWMNLLNSIELSVLSLFRVTIDWFRFDKRMYVTILQLMTTIHSTLSHKLVFSVTLLGNGFQWSSSDFGLTTLQCSDRLTPTSYSHQWLQPVRHSAASFRVGLTFNSQSATSAASSRMSSELN
jgi:hypothetical protein